MNNTIYRRMENNVDFKALAKNEKEFFEMVEMMDNYEAGSTLDEVLEQYVEDFDNLCDNTIAPALEKNPYALGNYNVWHELFWNTAKDLYF